MKYLKKINENFSADSGQSLLDQALQMDKAFDLDPLYVKYEQEHMRGVLRKQIAPMVGGDESLVDDAMIDQFLELSKSATPELGDAELAQHLVDNKEGVRDVVRDLIALTNNDEEYELSGRLQTYSDLLSRL